MIAPARGVECRLLVVSTARALAVRVCFDCHSNETRWPWYMFIAPVSWLTQRDVDEGREALNFSARTRGCRRRSASA